MKKTLQYFIGSIIVQIISIVVMSYSILVDPINSHLFVVGSIFLIVMIFYQYYLAGVKSKAKIDSEKRKLK